MPRSGSTTGRDKTSEHGAPRDRHTVQPGGPLSTNDPTEHRDEADWHAGLHRSFVAGNPTRQQLIATLGGLSHASLPFDSSVVWCPDTSARSQGARWACRLLRRRQAHANNRPRPEYEREDRDDAKVRRCRRDQARRSHSSPPCAPDGVGARVRLARRPRRNGASSPATDVPLSSNSCGFRPPLHPERIADHRRAEPGLTTRLLPRFRMATQAAMLKNAAAALIVFTTRAFAVDVDRCSVVGGHGGGGAAT